jgi:hypothetical protein
MADEAAEDENRVVIEIEIGIEKGKGEEHGIEIAVETVTGIVIEIGQRVGTGMTYLVVGKGF